MSSVNPAMKPIDQYRSQLSPSRAALVSAYENGEDVPAMSKRVGLTDKAIYYMLKNAGVVLRPKKGLKAERHPNWKGNQPMHPDNGNQRARSWFELKDFCEICRVARATDRHHADGNAFNNTHANIKSLCRRCHQTVDGRLESLKKMAKAYTDSIRGKPNPKGRSKQGDEYARLYLKGLSSVDIARKFEVAPNSVLICLRRRGIRTRGPSNKAAAPPATPQPF